MMRYTIRVWGIFAILALAALSAAADGVETQEPPALPAGLEAYLEARVLEANGSFREALDAYERALREAPDVAEVRVSFASFLVDVGMADRAANMLRDRSDLGPDGLRVKALALAQLSARQNELVEEAEAALRRAIEETPDDPNLLFSLAQTLVTQGKVVEAEQIVAALREQGQPVWYMNALNEGHGFRKKENRDVQGQAMMLFFEKYLVAGSP